MACFHKFYLVYSWIPWLILYFCFPKLFRYRTQTVTNADKKKGRIRVTMIWLIVQLIFEVKPEYCCCFQIIYSWYTTNHLYIFCRQFFLSITSPCVREAFVAILLELEIYVVVANYFSKLQKFTAWMRR